jgi:hypothetical protein
VNDQGGDLSEDAEVIAYDDRETDFLIFGRKTCTICGAEHPASSEYFPVDVTRKRGLQEMCRVCNRARRHVRKPLTPEQAARKRKRDTERKRERYHEDPAYRERYLAAGRERDRLMRERRHEAARIAAEVPA